MDSEALLGGGSGVCEVGEVLRVVLHTDQKVFISRDRTRTYRIDVGLPIERSLGEEWSGWLGSADVSYYIWNG